MEGWIKPHRKIQKSAVLQDPCLCHVFSWLPTRATIKRREVAIKPGKGIAFTSLNKGQLTVGRDSGAKTLRCTPSAFRHQLKRLPKTGAVERATNGNWTVVTIVNWATSQNNSSKKRQSITGPKSRKTLAIQGSKTAFCSTSANRAPIERQSSANQAPIKRQSSATNKKGKKEEEGEKEKKEKKRGRSASFDPVSVPMPTEPGESFRREWSDWVADRKARGKPLTENAVDRQLKKLAQWGPRKAAAAIDEAINGGWSGLYEPKNYQEESETKPRKLRQPIPRRMLAQILNQSR